MSDDGPVWRTPLALRVAFSLAAAVALACTALPTSKGNVTFPLSGDYTHDVGFRALAVAVAAYLLCLVYRPRVELRDGELVMRYMLWSRRIVLTEITLVTAGREGLTVETREGTRYVSPGFIGEKAPLATWLHRRTRADQIAERIMAARSAA